MLTQFKDKMPVTGVDRNFRVLTPEKKNFVRCKECKKSFIFGQAIPMPDGKIFIYCINEDCGLATEVNDEYWWEEEEEKKSQAGLKDEEFYE